MTRSEDDHYLLYTGGTTGLPKGVIYQIGGLTRELAALVGPFIGSAAPVTCASDVVDAAQGAHAAGTSLTSLILPPLMHGTGMSLAQLTLLSGGTVVLGAGPTLDAAGAVASCSRPPAPPCSPSSAMRSCGLSSPSSSDERHREHPVDLSSLKLVMSSGAMLSAESKAHLLELAPQALIVDTLAASEAPMGSSITTAAGGPATTVFTLRPGTRVLDDSDTDVEPGSGERGRLAVQTDNPIGYYKDPVKTADTFREIDGVRYSLPGDWADGRGGRNDPSARAGEPLHQLSRREDLSRGGRGGPRSPTPRSWTRWCSEYADEQVGEPCGIGGLASRRDDH